jgi:hypothetical protein
MCLNTVTRIMKANQKEVVGFKVVQVRSKRKGKQLFSPVYYGYGKRLFQEGRWERAVRWKDQISVEGASSISCYPAGFHIFKHKRDAVRLLEISPHYFSRTVVKVEGRGVLATGFQAVDCELAFCYVTAEQRIIK